MCVHIIFMQADDNKYQVVLSLYLDIVNITYIDIHMNYVHSDSIKYTGWLQEIIYSLDFNFLWSERDIPRASNLT